MENKLSERESFVIQAAYNQLADSRYDRDKGWEVCKCRIRFRHKIQRRVLRSSAGLLVSLILLGGGYVLSDFFFSAPPHDVHQEGIQKATGFPVLTLGSGKKISLSSQQLEKIKAESGTAIQLDSITHQIQYLPSAVFVSDTVAEYHTLEVPKGGEYKLVLADGTRVWINSESTLRFPTKFVSSARDIEFTGEIYLEVAHDSLKPFYVHTADHTIKVLGTRFDVCNYPADAFWSTTLAEGRVEISYQDSVYCLNPGEHYAVSRKGGRPKITAVDAGLYTSWIFGKISFKNERLEDIIRRLQRWYDFDISYADPEIKEMHFGGAINRYNSFQVVLNYLERTANIHFEIQDKTVVVKKI